MIEIPRNDSQKSRLGLVLTGGGARAAYQIGVLRAIARMLPPHARNPFPVICGTSAGAINAAGLAMEQPILQQALNGWRLYGAISTPTRFIVLIWLGYCTMQCVFLVRSSRTGWQENRFHCWTIRRSGSYWLAICRSEEYAEVFMPGRCMRSG